MEKPVVGQQVYERNTWSKQGRIKHVKSVGRKYFWVGEADAVQEYLWQQYHLDTWRQKTDISPHLFLYESEDAYNQEQQLRQRWMNIQDFFQNTGSNPRISEEQMIQIETWIEQIKVDKSTR